MDFWEDLGFERGYASIWGFGVRELSVSRIELRGMKWCRPEVLFGSRRWALFRGAPDPRDVRQGMMGAGWVLGALAAVAEEPGRVGRLFLSGEGYREYGAYSIAVCFAGLWQEIWVDDYIPSARIPFCACLPSNSGADYLEYFDKMRNKEIWPMLWEKAYAKIYGGYMNISKLSIKDVLADLTGAPVISYNDQNINLPKRIELPEDSNLSKSKLRSKSQLALSEIFKKSDSSSKISDMTHSSQRSGSQGSKSKLGTRANFLDTKVDLGTWTCKATNQDLINIEKWNLIYNAVKSGYILTTSTTDKFKPKLAKMGLTTNHPYTILAVYEIIEGTDSSDFEVLEDFEVRSDQAKTRLLKIRNPWWPKDTGAELWCGKWCETDPRWNYGLGAALGYDPYETNGIFFMCFEEYVK